MSWLPPEDPPDQVVAQATADRSPLSTPNAGTEVAAPKPRHGAPKWQTDVRDRLRGALKKHVKHVNDLIERDANEADTRIVVTEMLCDALGFDRYNDLGTEYLVKGDFADYVLRVEKENRCFVEVKRCGTNLTNRHLKQVESYALHDGVEWIILTNGRHWQLHHVEAGLPVDVTCLFDVDILSDPPGQQVDRMFLLTKESIKRDLLAAEWQSRKATSPQALGSAILSKPVVKAVRAQLHRNTGHLASMDDIARLLKSTVLRAEACADGR